MAASEKNPTGNGAKEKILEIRGLDISFKTTAGVVHAIRSVDIDLYRGETVAIVGESGSGKSVTMKAAMGILASNATVAGGTIRFSYRHADGTPETVDILYPGIDNFSAEYNELAYRNLDASALDYMTTLWEELKIS